MRSFLIVFFVLISFVAFGSSTVYKHVDEQGNITFTDKPTKGAKQIEIEPVQTFAPSEPVAVSREPRRRAPEEGGVAPEDGGPAPSYEVTIVQPKDDGTVRQNSGNINVAVATVPRLRKQDVVKACVSSGPCGETTGAGVVKILGVDRGTHSLSATVYDADGNELGSSEAITIHLHRAIAGGGG